MSVAQLAVGLARAALAQEIADDLIGTPQSLHDAMTDEQTDNSALMQAVYELAFECGCCGWWASTEELNNDEGQEFDELCDECAKEYA